MSMREIKFRGKRVDNGEWVYGDLHHGPISGNIYIMGTQVIPETVGQSTGLKDRNGVEIWEGDVLRGEYYFRGEGWFDTGEGDFSINDQVIFENGKFTCRGFDLCKINECGEVIGNIHDNPELMGKKKWHIPKRKRNSTGRTK